MTSKPPHKAVSLGFARRRRWSKDKDPPNMSDLRIVLLGKSVSENSRVGNFILGRAAFDSEAPPDVVERVGGRLKDRRVTIINSPQLLHTHISEHQITQTVRECVYLSDPGPHAFILVLQNKDFTEEDMRRVKRVLEKFSEEAIKHTIVITTDEEKLRAKGASVKADEFIQQLTEECRGGHLQLDHEIQTQFSGILQQLEKILRENSEDFLTCEPCHDDEETQGEDLSRTFASLRTEEDLDGGVRATRQQKLNLVLCGSDETLKNSVSKLISEKKDVDLHGHVISLVELPALFNTRLSEEEVMRQTLRCVSLCHPGVHVFLLIIPDSLNNEDKAEMEEIQRIFSSRINKHMMILIMQNSEQQTEELDEETQSVIERFGGRHHFFGPSTRVSTLMDNIEQMLEEIRGEFFSTETFLEAQMKKMLKSESLETPFQSQGSRENTDELRIVLLGKTGVGKSAAGNTILGRNAFTAETSQESVTKESQRETSDVNGRYVTVIDTPGLFDTELTNEAIQREIRHCISMILPGPHVFIIVLNLGQRFTQEEATTVKIIQETFGEKSLMFTMVLFTRGDDLKDKTIDQCLGKPGSPLMNLIEACGNRYHVFNNNQPGDRTQVSDLLEKIDHMVNANGGSFYSCKMFREMEREQQEQQMKILMDRVRETEELMDKLEEEKERMKMMMEEERQNHDEERKRREEELKREIREQEEHQREIRDEMRRERETFKHEIEETRREKEKIRTEKDKLQMEIDRLMNRIMNERQNHDEERKRREEELKREIREQEKHQREIRDEMRRERETFKHEIEETRQEKENVKKEKENLQIRYDTEIHRLMNRIENERQNHDEERNRREEEFNTRVEQYKTLMKEKEESEEKMREEMKRERETFKHEIEETRREKEKIKTEKDQLQMDIDRLMNRIMNERQNYETERKKREEFNEREDQYKREIIEKEESEEKMREEMKREREEWEKQKLEEKKRREEEDEKRREKEQRVCDEFNERLKEERERMEREKEDLQSKHEAKENKMKILMEKITSEREELMKNHEEEKERMKMMMEEERQIHDEERKRREEELKREIREQEKRQREIRDKMRRERETFKHEIEETRREKEKIRTEKEKVINQYEKKRMHWEKQEQDERQKREEEKKKEQQKSELLNKQQRNKPNHTKREEMLKQNLLMRKIPANIEPDAPVSSLSPRRIVLLGKSGFGKSASGNTILGQREFYSVMSSDAVTSKCSAAHATVSGRSVSVVDTPGFFDTQMKPEDLAVEIARIVYISSPGPHAFLIVFRVDSRFTEHDQQIPQMIKMMFGEGVLKYSIILFIRGDLLDGESVEKLIQQNSVVRDLVDQCGGRFHVFNNRDINNRDQVNDLLQKIDTMIEQNGGGHYSNQMYEDAHKQQNKGCVCS